MTSAIPCDPNPPDPADYRDALELIVARTAVITEILIEGHALAIALIDGTPHAFQALCPHDKAGLAAGRIDGCQIICPRHLARFDLGSGAVSPGWKVDDLRVYPARINGTMIAIDMAAVCRNPPGGARKVWDFSDP
jgi:3-phenylpropionate/trans-cinnamate dioxygenase ferredoxin subunit